MKKNKSFLIKLVISITVCLSAGFIGSIATTPAIPGWYATLQKPSFSPPNFLFAPVWTTLYILMGISLALVWPSFVPPEAELRKGKKIKEAKVAITFFVIQLVLNSLWSVLFFGWKSPGWALIEIVVLWLMILLTMIKFFQISKIAGWLLVPYLIWVSFAAILNLAIFRLN